VEQDYKGVQDEIALIKDRMKIEAEAHYEKGQEYYDNNEYRKAILEWARALTYNPEHKDARKDMEKARSILKKREELK
jgi:tetratricopeptide (TPR) repeat protein